MFRSSMLFVVAAAVSQPLTLAAGENGSTHSHMHLNGPTLAVHHINVPQIFAPRIPVAGFPKPILPQNRFPEFGHNRFKHVETYSKWQSHRRLLGSPVGVETSIFSSRAQGTWMRFEHGYIVRYASGRTFIVRGGIGQAWIENGGVYGRLGLPKGNEFEFNARGHDAQVFERGLIFWNPSLGRFVVGPNKSKV